MTTIGCFNIDSLRAQIDPISQFISVSLEDSLFSALPQWKGSFYKHCDYSYFSFNEGPEGG